MFPWKPERVGKHCFSLQGRVGAKSGDPETCWVHAAEEGEKRRNSPEREEPSTNKEKGEFLVLQIRKKRWSNWRERWVCSWCLLPGMIWKSRQRSRRGLRGAVVGGDREEVWSTREEFKGPLFFRNTGSRQRRSRRARHGCELGHGEGKSRALTSVQDGPG